MTEKELRSKIVDIAVSYIGCKESNGSHKKIIDIYNNHKPLAAGYKVKYTDPWCATFASAVAIKAGLTNIIPTECSCERQISFFRAHAKSKWEENGYYVPQPGDLIFYNWDDSTQANDGSADHVGVVEKVNGNNITVIEGNYNNSVGRRIITVGNGYIRGYGLPAYNSIATSSQKDVKPKPSPKPEHKGDIYITHTVVQGETLSDIANKYGTTYQELAKYNGIANPNLIRVGQKIKIPGEFYTVKNGDTLSKIADNYGTTYQALAKYNNISNPNVIYVGQKIKIPK